MTENEAGQEEIIIEVAGADGTMHQCRLIETIELKNKQYAIFQDIEPSIDNRGMITAFEMIEDGDSYGLVPLEDAEIINAVFQQFCATRGGMQQEVADRQDREEEGEGLSADSIIELTESDGTVVEMRPIMTFAYQESMYLALQPIKDCAAGTQVSIYELIEEGGAQRIAPIQRDAKGFAVWSEFRRLLEQAQKAKGI